MDIRLVDAWKSYDARARQLSDECKALKAKDEDYYAERGQMLGLVQNVYRLNRLSIHSFHMPEHELTYCEFELRDTRTEIAEEIEDHANASKPSYGRTTRVEARIKALQEFETLLTEVIDSGLAAKGLK